MSDGTDRNDFNPCRMTLNDMLLDNRTVKIPIIQRDYAQGRKNATEIRTDFLRDIFSVLEDNRKMKLSFVYGTENDGAYIPYDGQQRLTLMYLVTLFLAAYSENWNSIKKLSNFRYYTRDNATDFCQFLTTFDAEYDEGQKNVFQRIEIRDRNDIKDKLKEDAMFRNSWSYEPTVSSMLEVLKSIQEEFINITDRCSEERVDKAKHYLEEIEDDKNIFFDWCEIQASDNTYIKMNGRGKPLSAFDNFKNTLYSELNKFRRNASVEDKDKLSFLNDFESKMDGEWTDFFWNYREDLGGQGNHDIAPYMMNFLFFAFELRHCSKYNSKDKEYSSFILGGNDAFPWIDEKNVVSFLFEFRKLCSVENAERKDKIGVDDFIWISKLMDIIRYRLSDSSIDISLPFDNEGEWICRNEVQLFKEISNRGKRGDPWKYLFIGSLYYLYLMKVYRFDERTGTLISSDCSCRAQWLELIKRLVKTASFFKSRYQDLIIYKRCPYGFSKIFVDTVFNNNTEGDIFASAPEFDKDKVNSLREYFSSSHVYSQLFEEIEKNKLKKNSPEWKAKIEEAESSLSSLNNMIYFLIELSKREGKPEIEDFKKYLKVAQEIIDVVAFRFELKDQDKFSAIMLSHADYRIRKGEKGSTAMSLCSNKSNAFDYGWKKFFDIVDNSDEENNHRIEVIRYAFNQILEKGSVEAAYNSISIDTDITSWRRVIIKYPELLTKTEEIRPDAKNRIIAEYESDWYLITSNVTMRVDSRNEGLDIDLYGMYREALDSVHKTQEESCLQCLPNKNACKITDSNNNDWYVERRDGKYTACDGAPLETADAVIFYIVTHMNQN